MEGQDDLLNLSAIAREWGGVVAMCLQEDGAVPRLLQIRIKPDRRGWAPPVAMHVGDNCVLLSAAGMRGLLRNDEAAAFPGDLPTSRTAAETIGRDRSMRPVMVRRFEHDDFPEAVALDIDGQQLLVNPVDWLLALADACVSDDEH